MDRSESRRVSLCLWKGKLGAWLGLLLASLILVGCDSSQEWPWQEVPATVEGFQATVVESDVQLQWQEPDGDEVDEYRLYRKQHGDPSYQILATLPAGQTQYRDSEVGNRQAFHYRMVPIFANESEGEEATTEVFVAFNHARVEGLQIERKRWDAHLTWNARPGVHYRVYSGETPETYDLLDDLEEPEYQDTNARWQEATYYRVRTIKHFENPLTGEHFTLEGPEGSVASLAPLPELTATVDLPEGSPEHGYHHQWTGENNIRIEGAYENALGPVTVEATSGATDARTTTDQGHFELMLSVAGEADWTITISETEVPERNTTLSLTIAGDDTPPIVNIHGAAKRTTTDEVITLEGQASTSGSDLASVMVSSSHYANNFQAFLGGNGSFHAEIPLREGPNTLTARAVDRSGNVGAASVEVMRQISERPTVTIDQPGSGTRTQAQELDVIGTVLSTQDPENLRVSLDGQQQSPQSTGQPGIHRFTFQQVALNPGANTLRVNVNSPAGSDEAVAWVFRELEDEATVEPPQLRISAPLGQYYSSEEHVLVAGQASSPQGVASVSLNGRTIASGGSSHRSLEFRHLAPTNGESPLTLHLTAEDVEGRTTTETLTLERHLQAPEITVHNNWREAPELNEIAQKPLRLHGDIQGEQLAGASVNGRPLGLVPEGAGQYRFETLMDIAGDQPTTVRLEAWDRAGNRTERVFRLQYQAQVAVEILSPHANAVLEASGEEIAVPVIARLHDLEAEHRVRWRDSEGEGGNMTVDGRIARADMSMPADRGASGVAVEVLDADDQVIGSAHRLFRIEDLSAEPLRVTESQPSNNDRNREPNQPITLHFNRAVDADELSITVRETAHGPTYDLSASDGQDALGMGGNLPVINVHRDRETVTGQLSVLPDGRAAVFYPQREFAYGAEVFVQVDHGDETLERLGYQIRPLPSFLSGHVVDQGGNAVQGVSVVLAEQNIRTKTDERGGFSFGFRGQEHPPLEPGRQGLEINPGVEDRRFGTSEQKVSIDQGRLNRIGSLTVTRLNPSIPFQPVRSGSPEVSLFQGALSLDLSDAWLEFDNGRDHGEVHVQRLNLHDIPLASEPIASPQWLFAVEPGVRVDGEVGLSMAMPPLYGSHDYIPPDDSLVILVGYAPREARLKPVALGRVEHRRVHSLEPVALEALDYLGYVLVPEDLQHLLEKHRAGEISFNAMLAALTR